MSVFQALWAIFSLFVLFAFGRLGIELLRDGRPHVAAMAASYVILVGTYLLPEYAQQQWALAIALVLGVIGLADYYRRQETV